jgi:YidC/Oxa1 family membrane protein insertase
MALLNIASLLAVTEPQGLWQWLIRLFNSFIPNYGLCIIIFTICLRLLLVPIDFFQRKITLDNKKKTKLMEPYMEKIQKAYAGDKLAMQQKTRELQKKFKYSTFGACLPAIVSMVIFITMFSGMRSLADYAIYRSYEMPKAHYLVAAGYDLSGDAEFTDLDNGEITVPDGGELFERVSARYEEFFTSDENMDSDGNPVLAKPFELDGDVFDLLNRENPVDKKARLLRSEKDIYSLRDAVSVAASGAEGPAYKPKGVSVSESGEVSYPELGEVSYTDRIVYDALLKSLGQDAAYTEYSGNHSTGFLWIKNIWLPDAAWTLVNCTSPQVVKPVPAAADFSRLIPTGCNSQFTAFKTMFDQNGKEEYGIVMRKAIDSDMNSGVNGYYVLAVLIVLLSILSTKLNAAGNPMPVPQPGADGAAAGAGAGSMKMMMWLMPIMMAFFAITNNAVFSLYMVTSSTMAVISTLACGFAIKLWEKKRENAPTGKGGGSGGNKTVRPKYTRYEKK